MTEYPVVPEVDKRRTGVKETVPFEARGYWWNTVEPETVMEQISGIEMHFNLSDSERYRLHDRIVKDIEYLRKEIRFYMFMYYITMIGFLGLTLWLAIGVIGRRGG